MITLNYMIKNDAYLSTCFIILSCSIFVVVHFGTHSGTVRNIISIPLYVLYMWCKSMIKLTLTLTLNLYKS